MEERDGAGLPKATYVFDDQRLIKQEKGGLSSFAHADHLSTSVMTDATGAMQARYHYSPYGEMFAASGGSAGAQPTVQATHLFAGERLHFVDWAPGDTAQFVDKAAVGLYYNRARWMDPRVGRFISTDTWQGDDLNPKSLHKCVYTEDDPMNGIDPSGHMNIMVTMGNIGSMVGQASARVLAFAGRSAGKPVNLVKQIACQIGVAFIKGSKTQGHHPLQQAVYGMSDQRLFQVWERTHQMFHTIQNIAFREAGLPPTNQSAAFWANFFSNNPAKLRIAMNATLVAARQVDQFCGLKGTNSFTFHARTEIQRYLRGIR